MNAVAENRRAERIKILEQAVLELSSVCEHAGKATPDRTLRSVLTRAALVGRKLVEGGR